MESHQEVMGCYLAFLFFHHTLSELKSSLSLFTPPKRDSFTLITIAEPCGRPECASSLNLMSTTLPAFIFFSFFINLFWYSNQYCLPNRHYRLAIKTFLCLFSILPLFLFVFISIRLFIYWWLFCYFVSGTYFLSNDENVGEVSHRALVKCITYVGGKNVGGHKWLFQFHRLGL